MKVAPYNPDKVQGPIDTASVGKPHGVPAANEKVVPSHVRRVQRKRMVYFFERDW